MQCPAGEAGALHHRSKYVHGPRVREAAGRPKGTEGAAGWAAHPASKNEPEDKQSRTQRQHLVPLG